MEEYLDQAETLLRDVVQSRDISTLVVLYHLRDLAGVLDNLKLYDECRLTANCALDLAEALGRRSLEFRQEQAETIALIAQLPVYQPRARTLFIQAISICEEVVENNPSYSNKNTLLTVLGRAGSQVSAQLGARWLERAVQLMTNELPPTMVNPYFRGAIYNNYGNGLFELNQYVKASEAYHESVSIRRMLVNSNPANYKFYFAETLYNMGNTLHNLNKHDDAIAAYQEALDICTAMSAQDPSRYKDLMADVLSNYEITLGNLCQISEATAVHKQAISFHRDLAQTGHERTQELCSDLHTYVASCYLLGNHAEAVLAYQEIIVLRRACAARDPEQEKYLSVTLHNIAHSFNALGRCDEANAAAIEALAKNRGRVFEWCIYAPDFKSCFVCQRAIIPDSLSNASAPLPSLLANSSSGPAEHPGADISPTPAEDPNPLERAGNAVVHNRSRKFLGLFRLNRAQ